MQSRGWTADRRSYRCQGLFLSCSRNETSVDRENNAGLALHVFTKCNNLQFVEIERVLELDQGVE